MTEYESVDWYVAPDVSEELGASTIKTAPSSMYQPVRR